MPMTNLGAQFVSVAQCQQGRNKTDYYDASIVGFILTVTSSGTKVYSLRYRDQHGKQRQFKIGDASAISFDKARVLAQRTRSRVVLGENPAIDRRVQRQIPSIGEFVRDVYLGHIQSTRRNYSSSLSFINHHLLPRFGSKHFDQITPEDIAVVHREMRTKGYAAATCNKLPVTLKIIYNLARRRKVPGAATNPASEVRLFEPMKRERYLSNAEIQRLRETLEGSENPQLKFIVPLLILLSCRKRELLDAKWSDFDLERRNWRIPMSKNGKPRNVPLSSAVLEILARLPRLEGCPFVVPNLSTRKPFVSVYMSWDRARKACGLEEVTMHDLRHTGASHLLAAGADLLTVSKVLGHSSIRMSQTYTHIANTALLAAVDAQADVMGGAWGKPQSALADSTSCTIAAAVG